MKLLSFGEVIWDVYPDCKVLGGAPLNFAAHTALLGADAWLVSAVGEDDAGREALGLISKAGVKTEYIAVLHGKETGKCLVTLTDNGVPAYEIVNDVAYDYIPASVFKEHFDVLAFGTLAMRNCRNAKVLAEIMTSQSFSEVFSDLNIRKPFVLLESIEFCLKNSTIVKISDEEFPVISEYVLNGEPCTESSVVLLSEKYSQIKIIIITKGEKGSFCYDCINKQFYYCNAEYAEVVSTVGAGDSFGAAFLVQYFNGMELQFCLEYASKISAYVCSQKEAVPKNIQKKPQ